MAIDWAAIAAAGGIPKSRDSKLRVEEKRDKRLTNDQLEAEARKAVRARDGWRCGVPGCSEKGTEMHHIVYRSKSKKLRWAPENLVYLCRVHHDLEHGGKITIQPRTAEGELIITGERRYLEFKL